MPAMRPVKPHKNSRRYEDVPGNKNHHRRYATALAGRGVAVSATLSPFARFESAGRGLRGFLAWWGAGLSAWLPTSWRQAGMFGQADEKPLLWIHTKAEGTIEYTTLFFVPRKAPADLYRADDLAVISAALQDAVAAPVQ